MMPINNATSKAPRAFPPPNYDLPDFTFVGMSRERSRTGLPLKATSVTRSFTLSGIGGITTFITEVKPVAWRHRQEDSSVIQKLLSLSTN